MSNATTVVSTESNTKFSNFPSRGEVVATIDGRNYFANVSGFTQYPLPSALTWKTGAGEVVSISFQTAMVFR